jgi:hypothetical protein
VSVEQIAIASVHIHIGMPHTDDIAAHHITSHHIINIRRATAIAISILISIAIAMSFSVLST